MNTNSPIPVRLRIGLLIGLVGIVLAFGFSRNKSNRRIAADFTVFGPPRVLGTNLIYEVEIKNVGQVPFSKQMGRWNFFSVELLSSNGWVEPDYFSFTRGFPIIDSGERYREAVFVPIGNSTWRVTTDVYRTMSRRKEMVLLRINGFVPFLQFVPQSLLHESKVHEVTLKTPPWLFQSNSWGRLGEN